MQNGVEYFCMSGKIYVKSGINFYTLCEMRCMIFINYAL